MFEGSLDFETYSEAGYVWQEATQTWDARKGAFKAVPAKWVPPKGAKAKGLSVVGASVYSEHPSTEVLTASYRLADGITRRWRPGMPLPHDLFDHLRAGGLLKAHNAMFERLIWENVCVPKYGWPSLDPWRYQLRCSMATARVNSLPGSLGELGAVLNLSLKKDPNGKRLLEKFSWPRNPTKADPRTRIRPEDDPEDAERLYAYCDRDVEAEGEASAKMTPMSDTETHFWLIDQEINWRGIGVDRAGIRDCMAILEQALERYGDEFRTITDGLNPTQLAETKGWLHARGLYMPAMDEEAVEAALDRLPPHPPGGCYPVRRVLEIRQLIGSASVKKLYAMDRQASRDDRLRNLIVHHGARTGRPTGEGPQPLNLPKAGPELVWCGLTDAQRWEFAPGACRRPFRASLDACPWCAQPAAGLKPLEWSAKACDYVLEIMATRSLDLVEWYFGDAVLCISGCIRGLFTAGPGMELIASDYSAIEAVVTAMLAREEWRIETFRQKKDIYLESAAKITGRSVEEYKAYQEQNGSKHPDRQKIGKVAELGLGFGGWLTAWRQFDDSDTFTDEEVKQKIIAWRDASPNIVELWGGQTRGRPWDHDRRPECFGFEGAAVQAIQYPGVTFSVAGVQFYMRGDALIVRLLSGRELTYHSPRLTPSTRAGAAPWEMAIIYLTWNSNPKYGPMGWVPMSTYSGRITENIVQATAHDVLRYAIVNLRAAGYHTVLHVYDEIVVEVPEGCGSIEEMERIMATMPPWAEGWPIRAAGGWRGKRYRKD